MPAIATYPGTVSPLRGLSAFTESEREVFYGRDMDVETLTRLVTGENFRAGLLHGEHGVGKTSLLRAGLVPHLRDHGYLALFCHDIHRPIDSFVSEVSSMTGLTPAEGETSLKFLTRVVADAIAGQLFIFVLDDVEIALSKGDDAVSDLGNLFARVMGRRYGGRARFLFSCANENVYRFNALEQRTGSLFPPTNRYELERFAPAQAIMVLERTLALAGVAADQVLARKVVDVLSQTGPILPADLQIAARALIELQLLSLESLQSMGGPGELERAWLGANAEATGNKTVALRLLAELASDSRTPRAYPAEWAAARASVEPEVAAQALSVLVDKGVVVTEQPDATAPPQFRLAHSILLPRVREIAAPARESSRRAYELLGSKVDAKKRLSLREYRALQHEGIAASTPQERKVIERSKRFFYMIVGAIVALPILLLVLIYVSMSGRYYMDVYTPDQGGAARVVVRAGRPGLSAFDWLPSSPAFGSIVADTGLTRPMVGDDAWKRSARHDIAGDSYGDATREIMNPGTRDLLAYALNGDDHALSELNNSADQAQQMVFLLEALTPIARGSNGEIALVESALKHTSPAVQQSALRLAAAAAKRKPGLYHETLAKALTSPDNELRRLAFSAAKELGPETARGLYQEALATNPEPSARRELLAMVTAVDVSASTPSADSAASILTNRELPPRTREKARSLLERAFSSDPKGATLASAKLAQDEKAPDEDRVLALRLMRDFAPEEAYPEIKDMVKEALSAKAESIRAAALPLYARIDPKDGAAELVLLPEKGPLTDDLKIATAFAWGEIAKTKDRAAGAALEAMLQQQDDSTEVRAAAAEAYGNVGRAAQGQLFKMVKAERYEVSLGAAYGLANSAAAGGPENNAVGGIMQLWKKKGKPRREAAQIFAKMARQNPKRVVDLLASAARSKEDPGLHVIGVRGLCNASAGGYRSARRSLVRAAEEGSLEVRRVAMECIVDNPSDVKTATSIASQLSDDSDLGIRTDAARALAHLVADGKVSKPVADSLASLAADDEREVRSIAIHALAKMSADDIPKDVLKTLQRVFERADETEKIMLLETAGALGATELIQRAIADEAPTVRINALDTAIATGTNVPNNLNAMLTDSDRDVRIAALERLASNKDKLDQDAIDKSLSLAIRDADREIAELALTTLARLGSSEDVTARLRLALQQKSEQTRVRAASACIGLVERDAKVAVELLTPLLDDPSHDVRAAMLPALATAWRATHNAEQLAAMLEDSEHHAMRRIAATAAFLALARTDNGKEAALAALSKIADSGTPLVRVHAELGKALIETSADGITFLQRMTP